ncbi:MAG: protein tyrosine kinase [Gammaproteobacteria bacterium HGW-Gammaproteobacteria-3]|nr:MAG: protein tyrosine kinase [Gammaproteobacteria bacterium HGW-Gammaproteobacteria-3]
MSSLEKALEKAKLADLDNGINEIKFSLPKSPEVNGDCLPSSTQEPEPDTQQRQAFIDVADKTCEKFNWAFLESHGYIKPSASHQQVAEEFRSIKRPLVINAINGAERGIERANMILVTSSVPGEGKSFTAINLAISIAAERDKQVLLIDADVAKPSVSRILGIRKGPGLIEYLEGVGTQFADIILRTEIEGLRIVPAGKTHQFSTELLASKRMSDLCDELSGRYADRIVIFDSPPLLAATQAEVLSRLVGQVVMVIEAEKTAQNIVLEAVKKLESCDVVLALLNKTKRGLDMNYYGYGKY